MLNEYYYKEAAMIAIAQEATARNNDKSLADYQLCQISTTPDLMDGIRIVHIEVPKSWRLTRKIPGGKGEEEVTLNVQGVMVKNMLPPFLENMRDAQAVEEALTFGKDVDPRGILQGLCGSELMHLEDNVVRYFERKNGRAIFTPSSSYSPVSPSKFRIGDVVEAQMSFTMFPIKDGQYKMQIILRGVTILDSSIAQKALQKTMLKKKPIETQQTAITTMPKRRQLHEMIEGIKRCRIDDEKDDDENMGED
ncbi:hypothetical protein HGRIS_012342 [Hohenbuehelia grisea]|uniref:Uncharacterized protein n=1 Tax=Hohenbuehelia grisea TaxID=104357 RepID=A0ABR3IS08_9AGAR